VVDLSHFLDSIPSPGTAVCPRPFDRGRQLLVARGRFELPSAGDSYLQGIQSLLGTPSISGPNVRAMLDHYTTGLRKTIGSLATHKRFRVGRTEVPYIVVENLIYI